MAKIVNALNVQDHIKLCDSSTGGISFSAPTSVTSYTLTLPTAIGTESQTIQFNDSGSTVWGSTFQDGTSGLIIKNATTGTKQMKFDISAIGADTTRTLTLPDSNVTLSQYSGPNQSVSTTGTPQFSTLNISTSGGFTINSKTPSDTQWGYLTALNQSLPTTGTPQFSTLNVTTSSGLTVNSNTPSNTQWGYLTALNQSLPTTGTPQFAKLGIAQAAGTEALEVTGNIKCSHNIVSNNGADYYTKYYVGSNLRYVWSIWNAESKDNLGSDLVLSGLLDDNLTNIFPLFIKRSTGYVGINNINPSAQLSIVGNIIGTGGTFTLGDNSSVGRNTTINVSTQGDRDDFSKSTMRIMGRSTTATDFDRLTTNCNLVVDNDNAYARGRGGSIGIAGRGFDWGAGNAHVLFARLYGCQMDGIDGYYGKLNIEVNSDAGGFKNVAAFTNAGLLLGGTSSTNPTEALDVIGNVRLSPYSIIKMTPTANTQQIGFEITPGSYTGTKWYVYDVTTSRFAISALLPDTGYSRVGIAQDYGTETLEVTGSIKSNYGMLKMMNGYINGGTHAIEELSKLEFSTTLGYPAYISGYLPANQTVNALSLAFATPNNNGTTSIRMFIGAEPQNGNVGIGTLDPSQKLDVVGNIKASGGIIASSYQVGSASSIWTGGGDFVFRTLLDPAFDALRLTGDSNITYLQTPSKIRISGWYVTTPADLDCGKVSSYTTRSTAYNHALYCNLSGTISDNDSNMLYLELQGIGGGDVRSVKDTALGYYGALGNTSHVNPGSLTWLNGKVGISQKPGTEVLEVTGNIKTYGSFLAQQTRAGEYNNCATFRVTGPTTNGDTNGIAIGYTGTNYNCDMRSVSPDQNDLSKVYGSLGNYGHGNPGSLTWRNGKVGINQAPGTEALEVYGSISLSNNMYMVPESAFYISATANSQQHGTQITPGSYTPFKWYVWNSTLNSHAISVILPNTGTNRVGICRDPATYALEVSGDIYATSLGTGTVYSNSGVLSNTGPSDVRWKSDISSIQPTLDRICKLNPVTFKWKNTDQSSVGFLADEIEPHFPAMVGKSFYVDPKTNVREEGKGLKPEYLIPYMVKAIQELNGKITPSTLDLVSEYKSQSDAPGISFIRDLQVYKFTKEDQSVQVGFVKSVFDDTVKTQYPEYKTPISLLIPIIKTIQEMDNQLQLSTSIEVELNNQIKILKADNELLNKKIIDLVSKLDALTTRVTKLETM